ncbi:hypothetical protein J4447_00605 [Candidatus Pacearchaeota archaeon]|nr:hypothetical protein [Candidatus Pacearchaeota archaeon]
MSLQLTLPFGKESNVKNLIFTILTKDYPLRMIDLTNFIRKRYGKAVTFQAVRKALLELVGEEVVSSMKDHKFQISKSWVEEGKRIMDQLYLDIAKEKVANKHDSISGDMSVYSFNSINEMMKFWQNLIEDWYKSFKKGEPSINAYQGAHAWEILLHFDKERQVMSQLKKKGIRSYILSMSSTPLDKKIWQSYKDMGIKIGVKRSQSSFDKSYYVATYGDLVVQTKYPKNVVDEMEAFFKRNKTLESMNLKEIAEIVNTPIEVKLTVIKNKEMAKQINKSIISEIL